MTDSLKTLLIHVRPDEKMRDHEYGLIKKYSNLRDDQFHRVDVFQDELHPEMVDGADLLMLGGSGDYDLSEGHIPHEIAKIERTIHAAKEQDTAILGICFGAQVLAHTLGGRIEKDEDNKEMGTFEVTKLPEADACPVFSAMPERFDAQLGHKDHIVELPPGAINLASTKRSVHQAFTFPDKPIYGLTFHPELDKEALYYRADYYATEYDIDAAEMADLKRRTKDTPDAVKVLDLFLHEIVAKGNRYIHSA
jgi:GMP synthase (glutamine-hydrolysing)